jgi:hypothetical protein
MDRSEREEIENLLQAQGKAFAEFRSINDKRLRNLESAFHKLVKKAPRPGTDALARNGYNFKG